MRLALQHFFTGVFTPLLKSLIQLWRFKGRRLFWSPTLTFHGFGRSPPQHLAWRLGVVYSEGPTAPTRWQQIQNPFLRHMTTQTEAMREQHLHSNLYCIIIDQMRGLSKHWKSPADLIREIHVCRGQQPTNATTIDLLDHLIPQLGRLDTVRKHAHSYPKMLANFPKLTELGLHARWRKHDGINVICEYEAVDSYEIEKTTDRADKVTSGCIFSYLMKHSTARHLNKLTICRAKQFPDWDNLWGEIQLRRAVFHCTRTCNSSTGRDAINVKVTYGPPAKETRIDYEVKLVHGLRRGGCNSD